MLSVVKGLEPGTLLRMTEVIADAGGIDAVARRRPVRPEPRRSRSPAACRPRRSSRREDPALAERIVDRLGRREFRLYTNTDVLGVELCGALKNVIAIAAGAADGLGFGDNGKAGLMTRGLAEMMRLGIAAGANPLTFAGLAGIGDVIATCGSKLSRNHRLGEELAKGRSLGRHRGVAAGRRRGRLHGGRGARPRRRGSASRCRSPARSTTPSSRARASSAASWTCSRASRRTSWPTSGAGWSGVGGAGGDQPGGLTEAGSSAAPLVDSGPVGAWRSLVAHLNGVQEAERSNRSAPTSTLSTNEALREFPAGRSPPQLAWSTVPGPVAWTAGGGAGRRSHRGSAGWGWGNEAGGA